MSTLEQQVTLSQPVEGTDHVLGPEEAPVTLVMYGDYQCPYTALGVRFTQQVLEELGESVRVVYRHFPLTDIHPEALAAAEAAEAAAAQGRFWEMHAHLFNHQERLDAASLRRYAQELGLDAGRFERELRGHAHRARVERDQKSGRASHVRGTPTFFINGRRHTEKFNLQALAQDLVAELDAAG